MSATTPRVLLVSLYGIENRGVRYISAMLRQNGFEPHLVLFKRWVNNQIQPPTAKEEDLLVELVRKLEPIVVGFGFGAPYFEIARSLTRKIRAAAKPVVLWGGVHPTVCPEDCIEHTDAVCVGEGEQPTLDLCRRLAEGRSFDDVPNLWVNREGRVIRNEPRPLLASLDSLPYPEYLAPGTFFIEDDQTRETDPIAGTVEYRIYPTRGCPYACSYCHNSILRGIYQGKGRYYRTRSVASVIGELEWAAKTLPKIRRVKFDGDVFAFPKDWIREFSAGYRVKIGVPFELLTYPGELDEEDLRALKSAGLCKVQTGIQSGSDEEVRDVYDRKSTGGDIRTFSRVTHAAGVEPVYDIIFDNPLARPEDKRAVVDLLLELERPFLIYIYSLTLFPKTALAREFLEKGIARPEDIEGRATKSFRQFRLSLDYPRPPEDVFWICLTILSAKRFVPRRLVRALMASSWLKAHPGPLKLLAQAADVTKAAWMAAEMAARGELTLFKLRQYGTLKRVISQ